MKKLLAIAMAIMLMVSGTAFALNNTHDNLEGAGFVPQDKNGYGNPYTLIEIPGYDHPVLAFETAEGTAYRIWGKIGNKAGAYPVDVSIADAGTADERFVLSLLGAEPARNDQKAAAKLTPVPVDALPDGFEWIGKDNTAIRMKNIYGQMETYVHGTYDNPEDPDAVIGWFKSNQRNVANGALMVDIADSAYRIRPDDVKQKKLPQEIRNGFQQTVAITCSNGFQTNVHTAYPAIDYEALTAEIKNEQATKTGFFNEYEIAEIPFETQVKSNKNMYTNEVDVVLQEGKVGTKQINYRVKYENGVEIERKVAGEKVLERPVKEILERGTREPDEEYAFGLNADITATVNAAKLEEGETLSVECVVNITGARPQKGYTAQLIVEDEAGNVVKKTTANNGNPGKINIQKISLGKYKITAEAVTKDTEDRISYVTYVNVLTAAQMDQLRNAAANKENTQKNAGTQNAPDQPKNDAPVAADANAPAADGSKNETAAPAGNAGNTSNTTAPAHDTDDFLTIVSVRTISEAVALPYSTEYVQDANRFEDEADLTVRNGVTGKRVDTYEVVLENGVEKSRNLIGSVVTIQPVNKVISKGTRKHTTTTATVTTTESIPFSTTYQDNGSMFVDDPQIVAVNGKNGVKTISWNVTYYDGVETGRTKISESVTAQPVTQVVTRGTKQHVIEVRSETTTESVEPGTDYVSDSNRYVDDPETLIAEGKAGQKTIQWNVTYVDGQRTTAAKAGESITVQPVNRKVSRGTKQHVYTSENITVTETIAKTTVEKKDRYINGRYTEQEGHDGQKEVTYRIDYKDGVEVGRSQVSSRTIVEMVPTIICVGTMTTSYEYVNVDYDSSGANRNDEMDKAAQEWAMAMATGEANFAHTGENRAESIVTSHSGDDVSAILKEHSDVSDPGAADNYGVGVVKVTVTDEDGNIVNEYYVGAGIGY